MRNARAQVVSRCVARFGLGLVLLAACEGNTPTTAAPGDPGPVNPNPGEPTIETSPIPEPRACQMSLRELAVYQAVKVPLVTAGQAAPTLNAPIIEGRRALFRAFFTLAGGGPGNVRATLKLQSPGAPARMFQQAALIDLDSLDGSLNTTLNFDVPGDAIGPGVAVSVEVELGDSCPGGGRSVHPTAGPMALSPRATGTLKVVLIPISYDADGSGRMPDVSAEQLKRYEDMLLAYYPTRTVDVQLREPVRTSIALTANGGWASLLESLRDLRSRDSAAGDIYYYGLVSPAVSFRTYCQSACTAGLSYLAQTVNSASQQVGAGIGFAGSLAGETLVHEIGHQHGRGHTPCGAVAGVDRDYPDATGGIRVWGFDFQNMRLRSPVGGSTMAHKDFMGYCNPQWISDYTFAALTNRREAISGVAASQRTLANADRPIARRRILLIGAGGEARWGLPAQGEPAGTAEIAQVLDAAGTVIDQVTVHRTAYGHGEGASFDVPAARAGWAALAIAGQPPIRLPAVEAAVPALAPFERLR